MAPGTNARLEGPIMGTIVGTVCNSRLLCIFAALNVSLRTILHSEVPTVPTGWSLPYSAYCTYPYGTITSNSFSTHTW